jgi:hypothetical protein
MSEVNKVTDTLKYIYGENLLGPDKQPRRYPVTIAEVITDEFVDQRGAKSPGFSLVFKETKRMLGVTGVTVTRQLVMATGTNAELLALSGNRSPYKGKLGVVEVGALADLLLVDGDPIANIKLIEDPAKNFVVIMKDGLIYKNALENRGAGR